MAPVKVDGTISKKELKKNSIVQDILVKKLQSLLEKRLKGQESGIKVELKKETPKLNFNPVSKDGHLDINFDQKMVVPFFVKKLQRKKRSSKKRKLQEDDLQIDASQYFETKLLVNSEEKMTDLNYQFMIDQWTEKKLGLKFNFK